MYNGRKRTYLLERRVVEVNEYGEEIYTYPAEQNDLIRMFVSLQSANKVEGNDVRITQCSHIGLTNDHCKEGDIIDKRWTVEYVNDSAPTKVVHLKEIESDGRFRKSDC